MTRNFMLFMCLICSFFAGYSVLAADNPPTLDPEPELTWTEKLKEDAARASEVIKEDASKAGAAIKSGAVKTGEAVKKGAVKTGETVKKGAVKTGEAAKRGYEKVEDYFSDDE